MVVSFSRMGKALKLHVVGQFSELFEHLMMPLFGDVLNRRLVTFELDGVRIKAKPTRSYDFTVVEIEGDFEPHINTKKGEKEYYTASCLCFRVGNLDVSVS